MRKLITALIAATALLTAATATARASVAPVGGGYGSRYDATPACGGQCFDLSNLMLGTSVIQNAYVPGDLGVGGRVGQDVNLKYATNASPNEDFTGAAVGNLGQLCGVLIPGDSYVCMHYPASYPVFESDWTPYGNSTGLCAGVALAGVSGENVTLRQCGLSAGTLWVGDVAHATGPGNIYMPWVSAADPNFSHQLVLTVDVGTQHPENQLKVYRLNLLTHGVVRDSQEFALTPGPAV